MEGILGYPRPSRGRTRALWTEQQEREGKGGHVAGAGMIWVVRQHMCIATLGTEHLLFTIMVVLIALLVRARMYVCRVHPSYLARRLMDAHGLINQVEFAKGAIK